jgi:CheY-like chemotaxis protein
MLAGSQGGPRCISSSSAALPTLSTDGRLRARAPTTFLRPAAWEEGGGGLRRAFGKHVLVIEESGPLQEFVVAVLQLEGADVTVTSSAVAGIEACAGGDYDVVLLDLQLPEIDAGEVLAQLSELGVPIVVFTFDAADESRRQALAAGAAGYIAKPDRARDFVRELMRFVA